MSTLLPDDKKLLYLLIPFALTLGMALDIYLPSIPRISDSLSTSLEMAQWTMSGFFLCFGLGQLFVGPISDQIGRKKTIFISLILYTLGSVCAAMSPNIESLIASRALQAFGSCGAQVCAFSIVKDSVHDQKTSEQIFTYLKGSMGFAPMVAPIIGAFIDHHFSWRASFLMLAVFGLLLMAIDFGCLSESLDKDKRVKLSMHSITSYFIMLKNKKFMVFAICVVSSQAVLFSFFSLSPHIIITKLGYTQRFFGIFFAINALTYTIASWVCGNVIRKLGPYKCIKIGGFLMILGGMSLILLRYYLPLNIIFILIPGLIASSGSSFILGPATSAGVDCYKKTIGSATALIGSIEAVSAAFIGSIVIKFADFDGLAFACVAIIAGVISIIGIIKSQKLIYIKPF